MAKELVEFFFRADNRSTIRALNQIAEKSTTTSRTVKRDSETASGSFKKAGESAGRMRGAVLGLAGTFGLGGLAFGIKDVVSRGEEWQAQQAQLQGSLKNTGQFSVSTMARLNRAAEDLAAHGGFGAAENVHALTLLVTASGSATKAIRDQMLATNIARQSGKSYSTVVRAMQMLEAGRITGLSRLGITVPKVTTAEDALRASHQKATAAQIAQAKAQDQAASSATAFAVLQGRFGGATERFSRTTAGQVSNLRNEWVNLQERLGSGLMPVFTRVVGVVAKLVGWLDKHRTVLYALLGLIATVTATLTVHAIIVETVKAKTYLLAGAQRLLGITSGEAAAGEEGASAATIGFGAAMDALPILALIAGLVLLVTHFSLVKKVAVAAWRWIQGAAKDAFDWIKGHWPLLAGIILAPFTLGISLVVALFHRQLLGGIRSVIHWIGGAFHAVFDVITWPFREAWKIIRGIVAKIRGAISTITNLPGHILHGAGSVLRTLSFGLLHSGGPVHAKYLASGGPSGTDTVPGWLTPGEYVLSRQMVGQVGLPALEHWRSGGTAPAPQITITPGVTVVKVGERVLAQAVTRYTLQKAARGPSSLSGGALATGTA